jgi:hypothetical protein
VCRYSSSPAASADRSYSSVLAQAHESTADPKGRESRTPSVSPCKTLFWGPLGGHHRRSWTPELAATRARGEEGDESIPDTKGHESWTPKHFSLQIGIFLGNRDGAIMANSRTPPAGTPSAASPPWWWARAMPRCGSTCARRGKKADESIPAPKGRESRTPRTFPCITACFRDRGRGPSSPCRTPPGKPTP